MGRAAEQASDNKRCRRQSAAFSVIGSTDWGLDIKYSFFSPPSDGKIMGLYFLPLSPTEDDRALCVQGKAGCSATTAYQQSDPRSYSSIY